MHGTVSQLTHGPVVFMLILPTRTCPGRILSLPIQGQKTMCFSFYFCPRHSHWGIKPHCFSFTPSIFRDLGVKLQQWILYALHFPFQGYHFFNRLGIYMTSLCVVWLTDHGFAGHLSISRSVGRFGLFGVLYMSPSFTHSIPTIHPMQTLIILLSATLHTQKESLNINI